MSCGSGFRSSCRAVFSSGPNRTIEFGLELALTEDVELATPEFADQIALVVLVGVL